MFQKYHSSDNLLEEKILDWQKIIQLFDWD